MAEKRSEPRFMCAELVNVLIQHSDQSVEEAIASLEDISASGACVQLEQAVAVGEAIEIVCSTCSFRGKVRNCRYYEGAYDVGVAFDQKGAWDWRRFIPSHLLPVAAEMEAGDAAGDQTPLIAKAAGSRVV